MKVPFFEYPRLWLDEKEVLIDIIDKTSSAGGFILQKALFDFEQNHGVCQQQLCYWRRKRDRWHGNLLSAIGLKPGDEVIISSHTMLATASN